MNASTFTLFAPVLVLCGSALAQDSTAPNTPPPGFIALFNGKDLSGWKGLVKDPPARARMKADELATEQATADARMREHWSVADGVLTFDGKGDNLCTAKDYGDFELLVDWKIPPGGDTGIYLRGSPQTNIWDNPEGSGGLYNNEKNERRALIKADKPTGEWNTFRVFMIGERATVYLNDQLVVDDTVLENYWERAKPIYSSGAIELQNHGNPLHFRNIYVREFVDTKPRPAAVVGRGDRVAIVGDSITEQKLYSRYMEDYLTACVPQLDLRVFQLGWSGERAPGFHARMDNDLAWLRPNVVTLCYGMNDGLYKAWSEDTGTPFRDATSTIVNRLSSVGVRVVVGSPGAVDRDTFKKLEPSVYNDTLAHLRDIARTIARTSGSPYAAVHDHMNNAQTLAKAKLGGAYHVCGRDGFHPAPNGHLVMAYSFLRAMGLDGQIGAITIDMNGPAGASDGHTVVASAAGSAEIESSRYPFCFFGDETNPDGTRSIAPFTPFNRHLNRFTLIVKNISSPRAKVTWGSESRTFTKEQLGAGINLAEEFAGKTPFESAFAALDKAVAAKQEFQTHMIKNVVTTFRETKPIAEQDAATRADLMAKDDDLFKAVRGALKPVKHTIKVEAAQ